MCFRLHLGGSFFGGDSYLNGYISQPFALILPNDRERTLRRKYLFSIMVLEVSAHNDEESVAEKRSSHHGRQDVERRHRKKLRQDIAH
jgi:hypothetical protein